MSRILPTTRVRPVATSVDKSSSTKSNYRQCFPCSTLRVHLSLPSVGYVGGSLCQFDIQHHRSSCRSYLRRCCTSTFLQSFLQSCRGVKSTALRSIHKLSPGSVIPSWIVAELSCILFDGFAVNCHSASVPDGRLQSRSSGSSQQLPLVLFHMVELSRPVVRSPA